MKQRGQPMPERVRAYDSSSKEYHEAFQGFLRYTDEKAKSRCTRIDVGAGSGAD